MSLRYTAEANMDEPALRDVERWKDKIEVRLDNRQVFFLFFGSALVACMLFVLGVIVGKRIESRGRADAPEIQDPLAVLDRVNQPTVTAAAPADQGLAFPKALIGSAGAKSKPIGLSPRPPSPPIAPPTSAVATHAPEATPPKPAAAHAAPKPIAAAARAPTPIAAKASASNGPLVVRTPAAPKSTILVAAAVDPAAKGKFTLQLSSFPDRTEADAFAKKFAAQGAFIITSEIPGKGTWYRVRVGNYASAQEATNAKANFEKQHNVIAYVAAR
ncbi:MAG TPA: SPOR domain-containing protein [Polyangia bacterium]|jgi:cell division protein FtsN|nr:SPOR domain-containing protein [Polyangia bacterium]